MKAVVAAQSERLPILDLLRFIAALAVFAFHMTYRGAVYETYTDITFPEVDALTRYGYFGIDLFFILSGFVILLTVERGRGAPGHFIASRLARLFPVFWVAATLVFLATLSQPEPFSIGWRDYLWNLTMLPGDFGVRAVDGVYWTLAVELRFYLGVAIYLILLQRWVSIDAMLMLWLAWIAASLYFVGAPHWLHALALGNHGALFAFGCLCLRCRQAGFTPWRCVLTLVAAACSVLCIVRQIPAIPQESPEVFSQSITAAIGAGLVAVFLLLCVFPSWLRGGGRFAIALGGLSYPMYLVHQKLGYLTMNAVAPVCGRWLALLAALMLAFVLAAALHWGVERVYNARLRRWLEPKLRFFDRLAGSARVVPQASLPSS